MAEAQAFWALHLHGTLEQLQEGTYVLPEIQQQYEKLRQEIVRKTGQPLVFSLSNKCHTLSPHIIGAISRVTLAIGIHLPALMSFYAKTLARDPDGDRKLEVLIVLNILHEMEHGAYGYLSSPRKTREELIENEAAAWAVSCGEEIRVFHEQGYPLPAATARVYEVWQSCGAENNRCWKSFISSYYAEVAERRE